MKTDYYVKGISTDGLCEPCDTCKWRGFACDDPLAPCERECVHYDAQPEERFPDVRAPEDCTPKSFKRL